MTDFAILEAPGTNGAIPKRAQTEVRSYTPMMRERVAQYLMGDKWSLPRQNLVEGLLGTAGLGETKFNLVDFTPAGSIFAVQEAYRARDPLGMALAVVPAVAAARPVARGVNNMASKSARIYDPPARSPRPFTDDYRAGAPADATGRLTHDIEGRPLTARYVIGRRVVGGSDEAFPAAEFDAFAEATIGQKPVGVAARQIGGSAGRLTMDRRSGRPASLFFDKNLSSSEAQRVVGHELGHTVHELAGKIDTKGLSKELKRVYNDLNNPNRTGSVAASWSRAFRPQDLGYKGENVGREHIAEAIRAYMADPNYLKSVAPRTAAAIRNAVYASPKLREIIQFNSIAAAAAVPFVGVRTDDEGESWDPERD